MENMAQTWQQRLEQQKLENEKMLEDEKAKQVKYRTTQTLTAGLKHF